MEITDTLHEDLCTFTSMTFRRS